MSYLLDTVAVSEWVKPRPDVGLVRWLDEVDEDRTFLSVLTLGELRKGVERLAPGVKQERLRRWLGVDLVDRFADRLLPVDDVVADAWGVVLARGESAGVVPAVDGLIAATAQVHGLAVVTRNVGHFEAAGAQAVCPWIG